MQSYNLNELFQCTYKGHEHHKNTLDGFIKCGMNCSLYFLFTPAICVVVGVHCNYHLVNHMHLLFDAQYSMLYSILYTRFTLILYIARIYVLYLVSMKTAGLKMMDGLYFTHSNRNVFEAVEIIANNVTNSTLEILSKIIV